MHDYPPLLLDVPAVSQVSKDVRQPDVRTPGKKKGLMINLRKCVKLVDCPCRKHCKLVFCLQNEAN